MNLLCACLKVGLFVYNNFMVEKNWRRKKIKGNKNFIKILSILAMLSFMTFIGYHIFLAINITNEKLKILEIAQEDVAELRIQNLELVLQKSEIVSMDYIEKEARDKLRYSKEDETLFVIPQELLESEWVENQLNSAMDFSKDEDEKTPEQILDIWVKFLFSS